MTQVHELIIGRKYRISFDDDNLSGVFVGTLLEVLADSEGDADIVIFDVGQLNDVAARNYYRFFEAE